MTLNIDQNYWANAFVTDKFYCINTYSGSGMTALDPVFPSILLLSDAEDVEIGKAILQALSNSRTFTSSEELDEFLDLKKMKKHINHGYLC